MVEMSDLRIQLGGATLAPPTDAQISALARSASRPDAVLPQSEAHYVKWILGRTPPEIERQRAERIRSNRDLRRGPGWTLDLAVIVDGTPVGLQSISGLAQWPQQRIVGTTSWLLAEHQRHGLGTRCRAAVLELAFAHLNADAARSWSLQENNASNAVSAKLGYRQIERHTLVEDGRRFEELVWEVRRDDWLGSPVRRSLALVVENTDRLVTLLGEPGTPSHPA